VAHKSVSPAPKHDAPAAWDTLLVEAVNKPGTISAAYSAFHNYSVGNQMLAIWQCHSRGIQLGPLGTFKAWLDKGRAVRKGEHAIVLCQPKPFTRVEKDDDGEETVRAGVWFSYRPAWFVVSQTDGDDVEVPALPEWTADQALTALEVQRVPFSMLDGNTQGYAQRRQIAINPVAVNPLKTTAHELAHILLGHTGDTAAMDAGDMPRNLQEVEAEAVGLIIVESLGMPGADEARGYVQHWLGAGQTIPESSAQRIFAAADKILRGGHPATSESVEALS
jgi:antirestriction protein ArdC